MAPRWQEFLVPPSGVRELFKGLLFPSYRVHQLINYLFCSQNKTKQRETSCASQ